MMIMIGYDFTKIVGSNELDVRKIDLVETPLNHNHHNHHKNQRSNETQRQWIY